MANILSSVSSWNGRILGLPDSPSKLSNKDREIPLWYVTCEKDFEIQSNPYWKKERKKLSINKSDTKPQDQELPKRERYNAKGFRISQETSCIFVNHPLLSSQCWICFCLV
jgi:hypothetical protein